MKKSFIQGMRRRDGEVRYKHDLGQHFLYDTALLRHLVAQAGVTKADRVLEIGPGAGTLTVCLCEAAARVIAVEVDEAVIPFLRIATEGLDDLQRELQQKRYGYAHATIEAMPWGSRDMSLRDPFGNRLIFTDSVGG